MMHVYWSFTFYTSGVIACKKFNPFSWPDEWRSEFLIFYCVVTVLSAGVVSYFLRTSEVRERSSLTGLYLIADFTVPAIPRYLGTKWGSVSEYYWKVTLTDLPVLQVMKMRKILLLESSQL
jgi:hypothetical protein